MKNSLLIIALFIASISFAQFDGTPDSTFGKNGNVVFDFNQQQDIIQKVKIDSQGRIYMAGFTIFNNDGNIIIRRLLSDGTLDLTFGTNGLKEIDYAPGQYDYLFDLILLPTGKIIIVGSTKNSPNMDQYVTVLNEDGSHYGNFNQTGYVISGGNYNDSWIACLAQHSSFLIAGYVSNSQENNAYIKKYKLDGSLDANFALGGTFVIDYAQDEKIIDLVQSQPNLIYALVANGDKKMTLLAIDSSGQLVSQFGSSGVKVLSFPSLLELLPSSIISDSTGKVYIIASSKVSVTKTKVMVTRLNATGDLDSTYGFNGTFEANLGASSQNRAIDAMLLPDGNLLVSGLTYLPNPRAITFQLATDGTLVVNYGPNGVQEYKITGQVDVYGGGFATNAAGDVFMYYSPLLQNTYADWVLVKLKGSTSAINLPEHFNKMIVKAYPNPCTSVCNLSLENFEGKNVTIEVFNMQGQLMATYPDISANGSFELDMSFYKKGAYVTTVTSESKVASFIIQKL